MSKPSFRIDDLGGIVLVHGFDDIHNHYEGWERELPALKSAIRDQVERGGRAFIFDVRSASADATYPVVKWGAMYGAVRSLKKLLATGDDTQGTSGWRAAGMVKLVVAEGQMAELEIYRMTELFDHFAELEEAVRALRAT